MVLALPCTKFLLACTTAAGSFLSNAAVEEKYFGRWVENRCSGNHSRLPVRVTFGTCRRADVVSRRGSK